MEETSSGSSRGSSRRGRPGKIGSSVLTPPVGIPEVPTPRLSPEARALPPTAPVVPPKTVVAPCLCGHAREAHKHYRRGSDCGACGLELCGEYRRKGGLVRRMLRSLGLVS